MARKSNLPVYPGHESEANAIARKEGVSIEKASEMAKDKKKKFPKKA